MRLPGRWKTALAAVMLAGLSPTQAGEILSLRITKQGQVELTFESDRGTTYEVQGSEDLQSFSLLTRLQGAEGKTRVLVDNPTGGVPDRRFFKVRPRELPPAPTWFRSYGGSREESHGHYILACEDGGYLQVGETGFLPDTRILAVKIDASGNLAWRQEYSNRTTGASGHGTYNLGNSVVEITDGYLIVGAINRNSAVLKVDKRTGVARFVRTHSNGGYDAYEHLVVTDDGMVAVGYTNAEDRENTFFAEGRGYLAFLDPDGNKAEGRSLRDDLAQAYRIASHGDALIVSGLAWNEDDNLDFRVLKLDAGGAPAWSRRYGGDRDDHCFGMDLASDGAIFLTGHTLSGTQNWQTYTMKLDQQGVVQWERKRGNPRGFDPRFIHDEAWGVRATPDGGCILTAGTGDEYRSYSETIGSDQSDQWEVYVIKYGPAGELEWEATYEAEEGDWAGEDLALTQDGGVIIAVDDSQFGFLKLPSW
ncbi:MAG: hypothetical protein CMP28_13690 [Roseibacillus sp.]|nr:hypothetical protein [Roseibacillus sp.]